MVTTDEIFERLTHFIIKERWEYNFPLTRDSKLQEDLLIYGDDADEFILAFGKEFEVDVHHFPLGDYFDDEGDPILPAIIRMFTGKAKRSTKTITIGDLEKAVIAGRLDEEVLNKGSIR